MLIAILTGVFQQKKAQNINTFALKRQYFQVDYIKGMSPAVLFPSVEMKQWLGHLGDWRLAAMDMAGFYTLHCSLQKVTF